MYLLNNHFKINYEAESFDGKRDELESRVFKVIWLGRSEEADYLIGKLRSIPKSNLKIVVNTKTEQLLESLKFKKCIKE